MTEMAFEMTHFTVVHFTSISNLPTETNELESINFTKMYRLTSSILKAI